MALKRTKNLIFGWDETFPVGRAGFSWACSFRDGLARVECAGETGYIEKTGRFHQMKYDSVGDFSEGMASFVVNEYTRCGYMDTRFSVVIAPEFDDAAPFHNGLAIVRQGAKKGFINKRGGIVIPCQFDDAAPFSEGLAAIRMDGLYGFIDMMGVIVIQPRFNSARSFSDGLAAVEENGRWGFIDKTGKYAF